MACTAPTPAWARAQTGQVGAQHHALAGLQVAAVGHGRGQVPPDQLDGRQGR